jgi:hypothetical protein
MIRHATGLLCHAVAFTLLVAAFGCPRPQPPNVYTADSLVMERSTCHFGGCPAYRLRVARGGAVQFQMRNPGDTAGPVTDTIGSQAYVRLLGDLVEAWFLELPERIEDDRHFCPSAGTDQDSVTITVYWAHFTKRVRDYYGCHWAPVALRILEARIDRTTRSDRWAQPPTRRK